MNRRIARGAVISGLAAGFLLTACINYEGSEVNNAPSGTEEVFDPPRTGSVYFRSDVLGKRDGKPTPVLTDVLNGATLSLHGQLLELRTDAVVLMRKGRRVWIPRENVLAVTFDEPSGL